MRLYKRCRYPDCRRRVRFEKHHQTGRALILDAVPAGTMKPGADVRGLWVVTAASGARPAILGAPGGAKLYRSHYATCTQADTQREYSLAVQGEMAALGRAKRRQRAKASQLGMFGT